MHAFDRTPTALLCDEMNAVSGEEWNLRGPVQPPHVFHTSSVKPAGSSKKCRKARSNMLAMFLVIFWSIFRSPSTRSRNAVAAKAA